MSSYEIEYKLRNRFSELLFNNVEVDAEIKECILDKYMKNIMKQFKIFFKGKNSITDNLLNIFMEQ